MPIGEPEVLMDGPHTLERCETVTAAALDALYEQLDAHRVDLTGTILKPNMVISGTECSNRAGVQEVAEATVRCLTAHVPAAVPGIAFLSGGQSAEEATAHLSVMNGIGDHPWPLSFSDGRALQAPALAAWQGKPENFKAGQDVFGKRARLNGLARTGGYSADLEAA